MRAPFIWLTLVFVTSTACSNTSVTTESAAAGAEASGSLDAQEGESSSAPSPTTVPGPTSTEPSPPTTPGSSTTMVEEPTSSPELPDNFGDDFADIWDEIQAFLDDMAVDPQPELVDVVIDPECSCYQFWLDLFTELHDNGWYYTGEPVETLAVTVLEVTGDDVVLSVSQRGAASEVLDADGLVVREEAAWTQMSSVALRRNEEGRWRIFNVVGS